VQTLLAGGCRPLINILSDDVLRTFEQHVFTVLRDATDVENPLILLNCLAIMRILIEGGQKDVALSTSGGQCLAFPVPNTPSRHWSPDAMRSFFDGVKAHKAVQLIVLRVIWACKATAEAQSEAYNCVRLANYILAGINDNVKQDWCAKNPAIERKLHEKSLGRDMSAELRFQVR